MRNFVTIFSLSLSCLLLTACADDDRVGFVQGTWIFDGQLRNYSCNNAPAEQPSLEINFLLDQVGESVRGFGSGQRYSGQKTSNDGLSISSNYRIVQECIGEEIITLDATNIVDLYSDLTTVRITTNCDSGSSCFVEYQGVFSGTEQDDDFFE